MPRWLAYFGYVVGLLLFAIPLVMEQMGVSFPFWVLIVSVTILVSRSKAASPR